MAKFHCDECCECVKVNNKKCCHEMWDTPCAEIEECPCADEFAELEEIDKKAQKNKVNHGVSYKKASSESKKSVKKTISDEKKQIFDGILAYLSENYDCGVLIDGKKCEINLNGKHFTVDLVENRQKK